MQSMTTSRNVLPRVDRAAMDPIRARPWSRRTTPRRILAIRLQALGDVVITFPYLQDLRERHPNAPIDLLTRDEYEELPRALQLFARVFSIGGGRSARRQMLSAMTLLP